MHKVGRMRGHFPGQGSSPCRSTSSIVYITVKQPRDRRRAAGGGTARHAVRIRCMQVWVPTPGVIGSLLPWPLTHLPRGRECRRG